MADEGQVPELTVDGPIATLTLRRPAVANRLEIDDLRVLRDHIRALDDREDVRVLCLQSTGRYFCSGFNVGSLAQTEGDAVDFETLADTLARARPVTVAAIQGSFYGGATDLALACDFRLGVRTAECMVPAARLGLHFYRGGLERMVSRLGVDMAKRILLACERLDAPTLHAAGLLTRLYDDEAALRQGVDALCRQLAGMGPLALLPMKRHLDAIARQALDTAQLASDIATAAASQDLREGMAAQREKRPPRFEGR